jgi:hypothetical protein
MSASALDASGLKVASASRLQILVDSKGPLDFDSKVSVASPVDSTGGAIQSTRSLGESTSKSESPRCTVQFATQAARLVTIKSRSNLLSPPSR